MQDFTRTELYNRNWSFDLINQLLDEADSYTDYDEFFHRRRVLKAENSRTFILSTYNKQINEVISKSSIKKIPKNLIKELGLGLHSSQNKNKKELIVEFFKGARKSHRKIEVDLIFAFSLEDMILILSNNSFKSMLTEEAVESYELNKKINDFVEKYEKSYEDIIDLFKTNPSLNELEKIENELIKEKSIKDKKFREITKVEDIENFYKKARSIKRDFKAFLGPTNSGKTYNAIQALLASNSAVYLAPLRLLAREVYDTLKDKGIKVSLITGEEKIIDENATHICSTIEALNINKKFDLAVIDEVQFLNDRQRGSAWTRAVYGVYADNVICLGSSNSENVLRKILRKTNEDLEVTYLERKTALSTADIIYDVKQLKKGDAVIAFSRKKIYDYKHIIEENTNLSVGVIYGMLPPEIRIKTAERFNDSEFDVIIATDAIGIGLNLEIQRIVFTDLEKYNGQDFEDLTTNLFKQISGRAGRYKKYDEGFVTLCEDLAYEYNDKKWQRYTSTLHNLEEDIEKIYFFPELEHLMKISDELNELKDLKKIINKYEQFFQDTSGLFIKNFSFVEENLNIVNSLPLSLDVKYRLLFAPVSRSNRETFGYLLNKLCNEEEILFDDLTINTKRYPTLEETIQDINIYRWMHFSFPETFYIGELDDFYEETLIELDKQMIESSKRN